MTEVVNYAYDGDVILLFEKEVAHNRSNTVESRLLTCLLLVGWLEAAWLYLLSELLKAVLHMCRHKHYTRLREPCHLSHITRCHASTHSRHETPESLGRRSLRNRCDEARHAVTAVCEARELAVFPHCPKTMHLCTNGCIYKTVIEKIHTRTTASTNFFFLCASVMQISLCPPISVPVWQEEHFPLDPTCQI